VVSFYVAQVYFINKTAGLGMFAVQGVHAEYKVLRGEVKNGMVSPVSFILAKALIEIPFMFLFSLAAIGIPDYVMLQAYPDNFGVTFMLVSVGVYAFEGIASTVAILCNEQLGPIVYTMVLFVTFLNCGFLLQPDSLIWPFKVLYYIMPTSYLQKCMGFLVIIDETFKPCKPDTFVCFTQSGEIAYYVFTLLLPYHEDIESYDDVWTEIGIVFAIAIAFKMISVASMIFMTESVSKFAFSRIDVQISVGPRAIGGTNSPSLTLTPNGRKATVAPLSLLSSMELAPITGKQPLPPIGASNSRSEQEEKKQDLEIAASGSTSLVLSFKNISYDIMSKNGEPKSIIQNLSSTVESGSVLAIMGKKHQKVLGFRDITNVVSRTFDRTL